MIRRARNKIESLLNEEGAWVEDKEQLKGLATKFYGDLLTLEPGGIEDFILSRFPQASEETKRILLANFTMEETKKALWQMGSWKAPVPDGFHVGFFKRTRECTGASIHRFFSGVLQGADFPPEAIESLLVLVPKKTKPSSIKDFKPIVLCNVSVKLVSKVTANRVKVMLKEVVSSNQPSFILGRHIGDNVIICQEILHILRYTKARKGGMISKIDMEKAYDRMEWDFVEETLGDANIPQALIKAIMKLIQKSSCRLIWNGEATDI